MSDEGCQNAYVRSRTRGAALLSVIFPAVLVVMCVMKGQAVDLPLSELDERFTPLETPVTMHYDVGYRFLNIELRKVGKVVATTTIGTWRHRVTGQSVPALFLDMRVDSPDNGKPGSRGRVSIHDRIIAVMTVPDMQALVFAKHTDEYLRPMIRATESRGTSIYDTQSGWLEYQHRNLVNGTVSTNLSNPEALLELSRKIRPVMEFLVMQDKGPTPDAAVSDKARIVANIDGKVAAIRILTSRDRSPTCLARQHLDSLLIRTVAERGSAVTPRDFHAWSMTFEKLASTLHDESLMQASRKAPVETVVPMAVDYELGLGSVRATMTSIHLGTVTPSDHPLVMAEGPKTVSQK